MFDNLTKKLINWSESKNSNLFFSSISMDQFIYFFIHGIQSKDIQSYKKTIFVVENDDEVQKASKLLKSMGANHITLSDYKLGIYDANISCEKEINYDISNYYTLYHEEWEILLVTYSKLFMYSLDPKFFENKFSLQVSDIIAPHELAKNLVKMGYVNQPAIEIQGSFSRKGEIFDIYPVGQKPYRIHYFDDMIEEIIEIDLKTQRTLREKQAQEILILPSIGSICNKEELNKIRNNLPKFQINQKSKHESKNYILDQLKNGIISDYQYGLYLLGSSHKKTLYESIDSDANLIFLESDKSNENHALFIDDLISSYNFIKEDNQSECILPDPKKFLQSDFEIREIRNSIHTNSLNFSANIEKKIENIIDVNFIPLTNFFSGVQAVSELDSKLKKIIIKLKEEYEKRYKIVFIYQNKRALEEFEYLVNETFGISPIIHSQFNLLENGFVYENEKIIVLTENFLFKSKKNKASKKVSTQELDLFAEQLESLKMGDYLIHSQYGVGKYLGNEIVTNGGLDNDFLVLEYAENDKVYVPTYRLDLIQKYSDSSKATRLANLRTKKFDDAKAKARQAVKKLAFNLLELQAKRMASKAYAFSAPDHLYEEFSLQFPFKETPDQENAIKNVIEDMQKDIPMDRLVCGDVGFGKTEVAMRAAFFAACENKQTAVIVPTTVLCLQHYHSFSKRFKDFPINIEFISRLKTPKETKIILEKLKKGDIDILIGTHKLLSDSIEFNDISLLIIDEEQRFGVAHKEKLKNFKNNIHVLTLTATPIPRTMQLSFLGLKNLSLIKTAPPNRQSIRTYLAKEEKITIKNSIERELSRGGQLFYVHNKVKDIQIVHDKLIKLIPKAKIIIAHGQMPEKELEKRITSFYNGEYDILLCTTIIESGLDIPNANTIIIDRADTFGLSQLHQLRGRVGRSNRKAFAYFLIPQNKTLNEIATKRLKALQSYTQIGSGFSLASSDLEIRGSGDILGAEQSGHIDSVGLETYLKLIKEEILILKNGKTSKKKFFDIKYFKEFSIPKSYIENTSKRLKYYKKISNIEKTESLEALKNEIEDIYGNIPVEINNLFFIMNIKIILGELGLKQLVINQKSIEFKFDSDYLEQENKLRDQAIKYFTSQPKTYQITPDFSVHYRQKNELSEEKIEEISKEIASEIVT